MRSTNTESHETVGIPVAGTTLIIADHASAHVPADIDLGAAFDPDRDHEAVDIGTRAVNAHIVAALGGDAWAINATVSRLVIDCNRAVDAPGLIPTVSDDLLLPGNGALCAAQRTERIARFYTPYHAHIAASIARYRPAMILSVHSFTPRLATRPDEARPWQVGVLYNRDTRLVRPAIDWLAAERLVVGDQQPYSGRELNHTMNLHAESNGSAYIGVELRQDLVADAAGQRRFGAILARLIVHCRNYLAHRAANAE